MMEIERHKVGFTYLFEHIGVNGEIKSVEKLHNLMPNLGIDYLLGAAFRGATQYANWYVSLYDNARAPLGGDTMTSFLADCGENLAYTATDNARQLVAFGAVSGGALIAPPNYFDFTTAQAIRGSFVTTGITRGATSGLLISVVPAPSVKDIDPGESLKVTVGFGLISA